MDIELKHLVQKYALLNALKFGGKANPGAVIGKIFAEKPELKEQAEELGKNIAKEISKINSLSLEKQKEKIESLGFTEEKEKVEDPHEHTFDFLKIRPQVVLSKEDLVIYIKLKLKELNINSVYISTDSKNMNDIEYIRKNLPTFSYKDTFDDNMDYAILESIICTQSDYFIGTDTSLYSTYIMGERIKMGYTKDKQEIKLNKSNKL